MIGDNGSCCWFDKLILKHLVDPGILPLVQISTLEHMVRVNGMSKTHCLERSFPPLLVLWPMCLVTKLGDLKVGAIDFHDPFDIVLLPPFVSSWRAPKEQWALWGCGGWFAKHGTRWHPK